MDEKGNVSAIKIEWTLDDVDFLARWMAQNLATLNREKGPEIYDELEKLFMDLLKQGYPQFPEEYQKKFREMGEILGLDTDEAFGVDPSSRLKKA